MRTRATTKIASKACTRCGHIKPLIDFGRHPHARDGRTSWCRECHTSYVAAKRLSDPEMRNRERAADSARSRALWKLANRHPIEFAVLVQQELAQ